MKFRRLLAVFFCLILALNLGVTAFAAKDDVGNWEVAAKAAILIDPDTDEVLYARNIHEKLYPASLTKVMTALLVLEAVDSGKLSMDTVLVASESAIANLPADGSNAGIKVGEAHTVDELLHCILVVSANEACDILAEGIAGSVPAFVELMNQRAKELGCENTLFANTNGLHDPEHYTTAWDLSLIAREARTHERFMQVCSTRYFELPATETSRVRQFYTTNYLIDHRRNASYLYNGAQGIKTGFTSDAGYGLIACAEKNDRALLSVVLGAQRVTLENNKQDTQSFSETIKLLDYGFNEYTRKVILGANELIDEVPVALSQQQNAVKVHPAQEIERLVPKAMDPAADIIRDVTFVSETVDAPIVKGQVLGQVTLTYGDTVYATVDLLADEDVSASRILVFQRDMIEFLQKPVVRISAIAAVALIVLIVLLRMISGRRRRRYGRGFSGRSAGGYRGRRR